MGETGTYKAKLQHLLFPLLTLSMAMAFAALLSAAYTSPPLNPLPFEGGLSASAYNALYYAALIAGMGLVFYLLTKAGMRKILKTLILGVYALLVFALASIYSAAGFWIAGLSPPFSSYLGGLGSVAVVFLALYAVFVRGGVWRSIVMFLVAAGLGALLGFTIPSLSVYAILIALSVYDVFAVFKGPLGRMPWTAEPEVFTGLILTHDNLKIGLGDLAFYSMLASHIYLLQGFYPFLAASLGILLGVYLSLKLLERRSMVPGLPLAVGLGIIFTQLLNFLQPLI
ncbi:hypothetical protein [Candidatus Hecatella orcuttiae]|jgi:presenilin-like A22 family membrane protease|uniref:hypothetical protein n=1 Tax=Candidatus Hecatella orcuttiae TaxID=1935119 RepID=UPI0028681FDF|nr:hypothetical protein [Candidatus Hecatella orcuttiae]